MISTLRLLPRHLLPGCRFWCESWRADPAAFRLYRRHYSARNSRPKQRQFVGPGSPLVLMSPNDDAVFAWRKSIHRDDGQEGIECTIFRNESDSPSSPMILEAERLSWAKWPGERLFTYIDPRKVNSPNPGYCFKVAGWKLVRDARGKPLLTTRGLLILEKLFAAGGAA